MKPDLNITLNKLISYALDNLLLDSLDETYTLNRLASACGFSSPKRNEDVDYGDCSLESLIAELKEAAPAVDPAVVADILFPMPRTVNYYFGNKFARDAKKGIDFLFDLYAHGYKNLSQSPAFGKDGFVCYCGDAEIPMHAATVDVGEELVYTPRVLGNHIASLENRDIMSDDIVAREIAYVTALGGAIAVKVGDTAEYMCCDEFALASAPVKKQISSGTVKIALLDYPVPVLAFNGIAKNAVARETAKVIKAAAEANYACTVAAAAKDGVTLYVVFADAPASNEFIKNGTSALDVCGVVKTTDCLPLLSVLEKGTALNNELAQFRPIYDKIGGVKLGAKAKTELGGALIEMYLPLLKAAATATEEQATALVENKQ